MKTLHRWFLIHISLTIDNDGEVYDDMQHIEIEPSDEDVQYFKTLKVFDNQDVDAHSWMVRTNIFSNFEVPITLYKMLSNLG